MRVCAPAGIGMNAVRARKLPSWRAGVRRYLVAGVLVWLPILATFSVVTFMLHLMDETLLLLPTELQPQALVGFALPGLGAVFALVVLLFTGLLVTNLIGRRLVFYGEELLNRIPLIGSVYGGVKSFAESVFSQSHAFRQVVMVEYPRAGLWSIGFLTAENVPEITQKTGAQHGCVFISQALNATSGHLVVVPRSQIVELDMTVDAAMKMIITCGVVVPHAVPQVKPPRIAQSAL
jgi:uncharacterized membrane protein